MFGSLKKIAVSLNNIYHVLGSIGVVHRESVETQKKIAATLQRIDEANRVAFKQEAGFDLPDNPSDKKQMEEYEKEFAKAQKEFNSVIFADESALNRGEDETIGDDI